MHIKDLQKHWNSFGKKDPFWAIIGEPDKKDGKWKVNDFFKTGIEEINQIMSYIRSLNITIKNRKALDFGCGAGRLTQALAGYFDEVCGVDISPSMLELANKYNRHGSKCRYYLNETDDLNIFSDNCFDLIYTNITLQHMEPKYSINYLKEFLRILAPHGLIIFQIPAGISKKRSNAVSILKEYFKPITPYFIINIYRRLRYGNQLIMQMHYINKENIIKIIEENGAKIIDIKEDKAAGEKYVSYRYCVAK